MIANDMVQITPHLEMMRRRPPPQCMLHWVVWVSVRFRSMEIIEGIVLWMYETPITCKSITFPYTVTFQLWLIISGLAAYMLVIIPWILTLPNDRVIARMSQRTRPVYSLGILFNFTWNIIGIVMCIFCGSALSNVIKALLVCSIIVSTFLPIVWA
jgi:hypothetical protein